MPEVEYAKDLFAEQNGLGGGCRKGPNDIDLGRQRPPFTKSVSMSSDVSSPNEDMNLDPADKKFRHKKVEQNRRETTKALLSELQEMLPNMDAFAPGSGINVVLESTLDYVKQSRDTAADGGVVGTQRRAKSEPRDEKMMDVAKQNSIIPIAGACSGVCGLRYNTAFDHAPFGMVISRLDGTMISCNKMFASVMGFTKPAVDGHTMFSMTVPSDLPSTLQAVSSLLQGSHKAVTLQKRCFRQNGDVLHASVQITCIHKDGKPSHFICYMKDKGGIHPSNQIEMVDSTPTSPNSMGMASPPSPNGM
mmetsp:Transcript_59782/g.140737  ORF Transcript_59782/g.140737 Transcript_59782/m.140737 type:complete len:305 (-) Transcript_59782:162-1076(-)